MVWLGRILYYHVTTILVCSKGETACTLSRSGCGTQSMNPKGPPCLTTFLVIDIEQMSLWPLSWLVFSFFVCRHKVQSFWKGEPWLIPQPDRLACGHTYEHFLNEWLAWEGQPILGGVTPVLALDGIKNQAEWVLESEPVRILPPGLLYQSCLQLQAWSSCPDLPGWGTTAGRWDKPFILKDFLFWSWCFIQAKETLRQPSCWKLVTIH